MTQTNAQTGTHWENTYGGAKDDYGHSAQQISDGGFIIAGQTNSIGAGGYDVYLIKTDALGKLLWQKTYGGAYDDTAWSVQLTTDGGYIITGSTYSFGAGGSDIYLVKTDALGNQLWQKTFGGTGNDEGYSVQQTTDGGYIIVGVSTQKGSGGYKIYIIKTDSSGNLIWERIYGGTSEDAGDSVQQTSDGGYIIAGYTSPLKGYSTLSDVGFSDIYLIKTDSYGKQLWRRTYGGKGNDKSFSVQQTTDGGYIIAGYTSSFGAGNLDVYLIRTDSLGNQLWQQTYGGANGDTGAYVEQTSDGGYIIVGYTSSFGIGVFDVYLVKTDASGNQLWQKTYGGKGVNIGSSVEQTSDGGYIIAGSTNSFGTGDFDVYLIKLEGNSALTLPSNPTSPLSSSWIILASIIFVSVIVTVVVYVFSKNKGAHEPLANLSL
jgi:hypothetical protein